MKKRVLTLFLALALCMGLAVPAFAAEPLTVNKVTISEVVITDEYESFPADFDFPESYYNMGRVGFLTEDGEYAFQTFGCYIAPDDAVLSFEVGEGESVYVWFFTLEDVTEEGASAKSYQATQLGSGISNNVSCTLTKAEMEEFRGPFDLVGCRVGDDPNNDVFVMFAGKAADEPTEPSEPSEPTEPTEPAEPTEPTEPAVPVFTDTPSWCAKEAQWAAEQGITYGYGGSDTLFAPTVECTHEQILTFLWRASDEPDAEQAPITVAEWSQGAINWAYEKGLIDDSFQPSEPCTRAQAVSYIWQAQGKPEATETASFPDVAEDAPYIDAVNWASEKGVTQGDGDGNFAPDRECTRGEIVNFLYRAYN